MGCDIHLYVERKIDNKWTSVDTWEDDEYERGQLYVPYDKCFYNGRNYDLFGVLAGVRNREVEPIDEPRGLPTDCDEKIQRESDRWGLDGHSHSWFLLSELLDYEWNFNEFLDYLIVEEQEYLDWIKSGNTYPDSWCKGVSGPNIEIVHEDEYETLSRDEKTQYYIACERIFSTHDSCSDFVENTLEELKKLDSDPDNIRIVFWFDN